METSTLANHPRPRSPDPGHGSLPMHGAGHGTDSLHGHRPEQSHRAGKPVARHNRLGNSMGQCGRRREWRDQGLRIRPEREQGREHQLSCERQPCADLYHRCISHWLVSGSGRTTGPAHRTTQRDSTGRSDDGPHHRADRVPVDAFPHLDRSTFVDQRSLCRALEERPGISKLHHLRRPR